MTTPQGASTLGGNQSNRAKRVEGNRSADLGLGHETTIPNQRIRWTVDEPACPTPEDAAVGGPSSRARQPDRLLLTGVREQEIAELARCLDAPRDTRTRPQIAGSQGCWRMSRPLSMVGGWRGLTMRPPGS